MRHCYSTGSHPASRGTVIPRGPRDCLPAKGLQRPTISIQINPEWSQTVRFDHSTRVVNVYKGMECWFASCQFHEPRDLPGGLLCHPKYLPRPLSPCNKTVRWITVCCRSALI